MIFKDLNKLFSKEANISALNSVEGLIEELDFSVDDAFQAKYLLLVLQLKDATRDAWMKVLVKVFGASTSKKDVDDQLETLKIDGTTFPEAVGQAVKTATTVRNALVTPEGAISTLDRYLRQLPEETLSQLLTHIRTNYHSYTQGQNNQTPRR